MLSTQAGRSEQLLRVAPHLTLLTIVLVAVWVGDVQRPAVTLERAATLPLEHPPTNSASVPPAVLRNLPEYPTKVINGPSQSSGELQTYVVQSGENISVIAERHGLDMWPVLWTNELEADETIHPGQKLRIPPVPGAGRTVVAGDTLESIATRFSVATDAIVSFPENNLLPGVELAVGTYLFVPGGQLPIPELIPGHATGKLGWPARGWISAYFTTGHPGIDIAANHGVPIYATDGGIVRSTGWAGGYGNQVVIDHRNSFVTTYSHLSRFSVGPGQLVTKGAIIGRNGSTGYSTGPHLHFEVLRNGYYVNPLDRLR